MAKKKTKKKTKKELPKTLSENKAVLNDLLKDMKKKDPDTVVGFASDPEIFKAVDYHRISTGVPVFDEILDGGLPSNKITVFTGASGCGKSAMAYQIIGHDQQEDPDAIWAIADTENTYDAKWVQTLGVDPDRLVFIETDIMEDILQRVIDLSRTGGLKGVLIDSLGALLPRAEIQSPGSKDSEGADRNLRQENVAVANRKINQFYRAANPVIAKMKTSMILIAHVYTDIGAYSPRGEVLKTKGGHGTQHFAHMRVGFRKAYNEDKAVIVTMPDGKQKKVTSGFDTVLRIEKTKQGAHEGHEVYVPFTYGVGFDSRECTVNSALVNGVIEIRGAWCFHQALPDGKMQGKANVKAFILGNDEAYIMILNDVIAFVSDDQEIQTQSEMRESVTDVNEIAEHSEAPLPTGTSIPAPAPTTTSAPLPEPMNDMLSDLPEETVL